MLKSVQHSLYKINHESCFNPENSLLVGNKADFEVRRREAAAIKMTELSDPVLRVKIF
jgi:hypothetical protein